MLRAIGIYLLVFVLWWPFVYLTAYFFGAGFFSGKVLSMRKTISELEKVSNITDNKEIL